MKKSPLYAFFSETLNGTSVVRAYKQQDRFITHSDLLLDNSQKVYFEVFSSNRYIIASFNVNYLFVLPVLHWLNACVYCMTIL